MDKATATQVLKGLVNEPYQAQLGVSVTGVWSVWLTSYDHGHQVRIGHPDEVQWALDELAEDEARRTPR